jgi:mono/diheme cytochrome c family protein
MAGCVLMAAALSMTFGGVARVEAGGQAPATAQHGSELFYLYCASCHGKTAQGDGPLAASLRRRPPNLTEILTRNKGVFPKEKVYRIIDGREKVPGHGGPDMPVWGDAFLRSGESPTEEMVRQRIQSLVEFLESIQKRRTE